MHHPLDLPLHLPASCFAAVAAAACQAIAPTMLLLLLLLPSPAQAIGRHYPAASACQHHLLLLLLLLFPYRCYQQHPLQGPLSHTAGSPPSVQGVHAAPETS
jgi:hypothetical protein